MTREWIVENSPPRLPVDFRMFIRPGATDIGVRAFNKLSENEKHFEIRESSRANFFKRSLSVLREDYPSSQSVAKPLFNLKEFTLWADNSRAPICLANTVDLARGFSDCMATSGDTSRWQIATWIVSHLARVEESTTLEFRVKAFGSASSEWIIDVAASDTPYFDFRALLDASTASQLQRQFNRQTIVQKNRYVNDSPRCEWIRSVKISMQSILQNKEHGKIIRKNELGAIWRFTRWLDEHKIEISRSTVFSLLQSGGICLRAAFGREQAVVVRRVLSWCANNALEREALEADRFRLSSRANRQTNSDWIVELPETGRPYFDTRIFVRPGDAEKGHWRFSQLDECAKDVRTTESVRAGLISSLRGHWKAALVGGASETQIAAQIAAFRKLVVWADTHSFEVDELHAVETLSRYGLSLRARVLSGDVARTTARHQMKRIVSDLSVALKISVKHINRRVPQFQTEPPSGRSGTFVGTSDVVEFAAWIDKIIEWVTPDRLDSDLSSAVEITSDGRSILLPASEKRWIGRVPNRFLNTAIARIRIEAESLRFSALTGANTSVALSVRIGDLSWTSDRGGYRATAFKARKSGEVSLTIPKQYRARLERHIEFVSNLLPFASLDDLPLFPMLSSNGAATLAGELLAGGEIRFKVSEHPANSFTALRPVFKASGINWLTFRDLRYAKGDFLHTMFGGDSLRASQSLGNAPITAYRHYGGNGNLPLAQSEMTSFWKALDEPLNLAVAPGACDEPGKPVPLSELSIKPRCDAENACFLCAKYRGIMSLDYIHLILSHKADLQIRAAADPLRGGDLTTVIEIIEKIVQHFCRANPEQLTQIDIIREEVRLGVFHPHLRRSIHIKQKLYTNVCNQNKSNQ